MKSYPVTHSTGVIIAKKARNARRKRLEIRGMNSAAGVKRLHFAQMPSGEESCCPKKGTVDLQEATSSEGPQPDDFGRDKKLKGVLGNMSSTDSCLTSSDSAEFSEEGPPELPKEVDKKDETRKVEESGSMTTVNCGSVSVIGRRRVMEDALTVAPGIVVGEYEFFAAYDGHGGAKVANACRDRLHHLLEKELEVNSTHERTRSGGVNGIDWTNVMKACFLKMDEEVLNGHSLGGAVEGWEAERAVGSTAVVAIVGTEELVVANCGDSRAVLCRGGLAMPLSNDHKPDRPDEKERVEAAGGRIINWDGCRVQGVLATSRSIGDHYLKPYVTSEPEVTLEKRADTDEFLIIATDGLWDVVSNDFACEVVRKCLNGRIRKRVLKEPGAAEAAAILAELAIAKGSRDNISVIVVDLKKASSKLSNT